MVACNCNNFDSDDESKDGNSMPGLKFGRSCYDTDSYAESKVGEEETVCKLSEDTDVSQDASEVVAKWLLDAGASIHADTAGKNVESCDASIEINIAAGNTVAPRGVGRKVIRNAKTKCLLLVKSIHVTPKFLKRMLSVSKLINVGHQVEFA